MGKICLNLGCGDTAPKGWINCDSSWNAQISKIPGLNSLFRKMGLVGNSKWPGNIRYLSLKKPFPWKDNSVDCVYASHVLEHLGKSAAENFMKEARRVLKKNGALRIVVPDLFYHAKKYIENFSQGRPAAEEFLGVQHLGLPDCGALKSAYNIITGFPCLHKTMYDRMTLEAFFQKYGFAVIQTASYGQSSLIDNIRDVEFREDGYEGSLYMEGIKPC